MGALALTVRQDREARDERELAMQKDLDQTSFRLFNHETRTANQQTQIDRLLRDTAELANR